MADGTEQGQTGGQASGQSSSSQGGQSTQGATGTQGSGSQSTTQSSQTGESQQSTVRARPAWTPESHWDVDKGDFKPTFEQHYRDLATRDAAEASRKLTLPKSPDEYKFQTSKNFQVPQGVEFKLDESNALLPQARALMHDIDQGKVSGQDAFERMIELHAAGEIGRTQQFETAKAAEIGKLGATGTARVTAVQNFLAAQLGEQLGKHMATMLVTAGHVEGFEKLIKNFSGQGAGSFSQQHRDGAAPEKLSDDQYNRLSFAEKRAYAEKHQQPAQNGAGR